MYKKRYTKMSSPMDLILVMLSTNYIAAIQLQLVPMYGLILIHRSSNQFLKKTKKKLQKNLSDWKVMFECC